MAAVFRWHQDKEVLLIVIAGAICVGLLVIAMTYLAKLWAKRKEQPFLAKVSGNAAATPKNIAAPGQRAKLDDLRKSFESGIQKYKAAGKDLYTLPWYALVGEPGGGKTEAIRHCQVGFPPGLQDYSQGAGGTINMNWWFTNHAVILDTAGRILFEEVEPGSPSEWKEFLNLLAEGRPNCPINGVILVIPAESLIKDNPNKIEEKAGKIAQQLDMIQRTLAVRFPVFIVITKCDLINGFREFFDGVNDPQLVGQILGWANPAALDQPFNPEEVDRHLQEIRQSLLRRRLGLLIDPVNTEDPSASRLDQVDSLYTFPDSLAKIAPKLQFYLQMIFVPGEWAPKPLFLRGIFLTSSMREGSALDQDLAEILKVPVETLPEGRVWERDHSYFLRDVFVRRVFKEKGLVTRVGNTKKLRRRRKAAVLFTALAAVTALLGLTFYQSLELNETIGNQTKLWQKIADTPAGRKENWQILDTSSRPIKYRGSQKVAVGQEDSNDSDSKTPTEISADLKRIGTEPHIPEMYQHWTLPVLGQRDIVSDSITAGRNLFERNILAPLIKEVRTKLQQQKDWDPKSKDATIALTQDALSQMLRLEVQLTEQKPNSHPELNLDVLFQYILPPEEYTIFKTKPEGRAEGDAEILQKALTAVYAKGGWPARWMAGRDGEEHKRITEALGTTLDSYIAYWVRTVDTKNPIDPVLRGIIEVRSTLVGASPASNPANAVSIAAIADGKGKSVQSFDAAERMIRRIASQDCTTEAEFQRIVINLNSAIDGLQTATDRTREKLVALGEISGWNRNKTLSELFLRTFDLSRKRAEVEIGKPIALLKMASPSTGTSKMPVELDNLIKKLESGLAIIPKEADVDQVSGLSEIDKRYLSLVSLPESGESANQTQFERCQALYSHSADWLKDDKTIGASKLMEVKETLRVSSTEFTKHADSLAASAGAQGSGVLVRSTTQSVGKLIEIGRLHSAYKILSAVLKTVPKDPGKFSSLVAEHDPSKKPLFGVSVPMTGVHDDIPFAMEFRADEAADILTAWTALGKKLEMDPAAPVALDQALLLIDYKNNPAPGQFAENCIDYWTKELPKKLLVGRFDWNECIKNGNVWTVGAVHRTLEAWCNTIQENLVTLSPKALAAIPADQKESQARVVAKLADWKSKLQSARGELPIDSVIASQANVYLAAWISLNGNAIEAADRICASQEPDKPRDILWTKSAGPSSLVATYWDELNVQQLSALANEVEKSRPKGADDDRKRFVKFPLVRRERATDPALDVESVAKAARWAAAQQKLQSQVKSRPKTNNVEVDKLLGRICPGSAAGEATINDVIAATKILEGDAKFQIQLPSESERASIVGPSVRPVFWSSVKVDYSKEKAKSSRRQLFSSGGDLGSDYLTHGTIIQIFAEEQREANMGQTSVVFPPNDGGPQNRLWTCFELLDYARTARPRSPGNLKEWLVEYLVKDTVRNEMFSLWLILKFPTDVPESWSKK